MKLIGKPGCNDEEKLTTPYGDAAVIISRFWTDCRLEDMKWFIMPDNWVACGQPFWRKMERQSGGVKRPRSNSGSWWKATYEEEVDLPVSPICARLDITCLEADDTVRLEYKLSPDDEHGDVDIDEGFLSVTTDTLGGENEGTLVEGAKVIRFTDPLLNELPDLACDGGWVYLMINMALQGAGITSGAIPVTKEETGGGAPGTEGVEDEILAAINAEIDDWLDQATKSLVDHGRTAKLVTRRVVGSPHDPRWMGDLVGVSHSAIQSAGMTVSTWRSILRQLAKLGDS